VTDPNLYRNYEARFDTVVGENEYFELLRKIRQEYDELFPKDSYAYEFDMQGFERYVLKNYGIKVMFDVTYSAVTADFNIMDQDKYLLARLKFA
jgi:hypothetical protein